MKLYNPLEKIALLGLSLITAGVFYGCIPNLEREKMPELNGKKLLKKEFTQSKNKTIVVKYFIHQKNTKINTNNEYDYAYYLKCNSKVEDFPFSITQIRRIHPNPLDKKHAKTYSILFLDINRDGYIDSNGKITEEAIHNYKTSNTAPECTK